jgi:hypothetical protein
VADVVEAHHLQLDDRLRLDYPEHEAILVPDLEQLVVLREDEPELPGDIESSGYLELRAKVADPVGDRNRARRRSEIADREKKAVGDLEFDRLVECASGT